MFHIPGYDFVRKDRPGRGGGGFIVYVKENIRFVHRSDLECEEIESLFIELIFSHNKSLYLYFVNRSPEQLLYWYKEFEK